MSDTQIERVDIGQAIQKSFDGWLSLGHVEPLSLFVLRNGQVFHPSEHTEKFGKRRDCFKNAADLAINNNLRYVEGYAISNIHIPIHHAWVIDDNNNVIDNTWRDYMNASYYGVVFSREALVHYLLANKYYGLLANHITYNTDVMADYDPDFLKVVMQLREKHKWRGE